jgi:hypothetical protein
MAVAVLFVWGVLIGNAAYMAKIHKESDTLEGIISVRQAQSLFIVNVISIIITTGMAGFFIAKIFLDSSVRRNLNNRFSDAKKYIEGVRLELKKDVEFAENLSHLERGAPNEYSGTTNNGNSVKYRCEALGNGLFDRARAAHRTGRDAIGVPSSAAAAMDSLPPNALSPAMGREMTDQFR